jgi:hypothetical protein
MSITANRWLAIVGGILLPSVEVVRRFHQLLDPSMFTAWFDDFLIGGLLLYGAWRTRHEVARGLPYLTAAWGFACGMGYGSFFGQLATLRTQPLDVSGVSGTLAVTFKGVALAIGVIGLITALMYKPSHESARGAA